MSDTDFDIIVLTPKLASELAQEHGIVRADYQHREEVAIDIYASDMATSNFLLNGDAIIFDKNGDLINGRKRILACMASGAEFSTLVIKNIDPKAAERIDQHRKRSDASLTEIAGFKDPVLLTAATSSIVDIARNGLPSQKDFVHGTPLRILRSRPDIPDLLARIKLSYIKHYFPISDLVALVYLTALIDVDSSDEFFEQLRIALLAFDDGAEHITPIERLAAGLVDNRRKVDAGGSMGNSATRYRVVSYATKAWNAWRTDGELGPMSSEPKAQLADAVKLHGLPDDLFAEHVLASRKIPEIPPIVDRIALAKRRQGITARIRTFTPKEAIAILADWNGPIRNLPPTESEDEFGGSDESGKNRRMSMTVVDSYIRDLEAVDWMLTGETIKFSASGRLLDGQHRLKACALSGRPLTTWVVEGLDEDVFHTFDVAINRSYAGRIAEAGIENSLLVQKALRHLHIHEKKGLGATSSIKLSVADLDATMQRWPEIVGFVALAKSEGFAKFALPADILGALMTILHRMDAEKAAEFFASMPTGARVPDGHPVRMLRRSLIDSFRPDVRTKPWPRIYLICHAWNAVVAGKKAKLPTTPAAVALLKAPEPFARPAATIVDPQQSLDFGIETPPRRKP